MKTEQYKKEIFKKIIHEFEYADNTNEIIIWDNIIETYSDGDKEIKNKIYNLLKLMNESKQKSEKDFNELLDRDIETDIWYII